MTDAIVTVESRDWLAPVATINEAKARYKAMIDFVQGVMRDGLDYGVIPGTDKPTLHKPGAEKLATFFGLRPAFVDITTTEDWIGTNHDGEPFFYYRQKCRLFRGGDEIANADGSCNSWEKKYRYRKGEYLCPKCDKSGTIIKGKDEYGGGWLCWNKKGGCGSKWADGAKEIEGQDVGQVKNPDIADIANTVLKMAQKRAYVAAVLLAVNGSEYFTQDLEDMSYEVTATYREVLPENDSPANSDTVTEIPSKTPRKAQDKPQPAKTNGMPQLLVEANLAENIPNASNILNLMPPTIRHDREQVLAWARTYRGYRDEDHSTEEAAELTDKALHLT